MAYDLIIIIYLIQILLYCNIKEMKNIRMSKKNPSKILKIIETSSTNRYHHSYTQHNNSHLA